MDFNPKILQLAFVSVKNNKRRVFFSLSIGIIKKQLDMFDIYKFATRGRAHVRIANFRRISHTLWSERQNQNLRCMILELQLGRERNDIFLQKFIVKQIHQWM